MRPRHLLEFIGVRTLFMLFELLPVAQASDLGGWLGRTLGPRMGVSKTARKNLRRILPERAAEHEAIIRGMWDNFGRVFAEYPHLTTIAAQRGGAKIDVVGMEHLDKLRADGRGGIIVSGHLANWEFGAFVAMQQGFPVHVVYRPPNNPWVDKLLMSARAPGVISSLPKGTDGAREIIRLLRRGETVALLIDQKMNDGLALDFMGATAMTVSAPAQLAARYQVPILPARVERLDKLHFRWTLLPAILPPPDADAAAVMQTLNDMLAEWIRERPEQWLWLHRRWKD